MSFDHLAVSEAIQQGDTAALLRLLTSRADDDHIGAITTTSLEILQQYRDPQERSLAHLAILANSLDVLEFILASGFDATDDCEDETGKSPLTIAMLERSVNAVKLLLTYGSDINQQDSDLHTPLHMLAMYSSTNTSDAYNTDDGDEDKAMIELILHRNGADVHMRDSCDNTPLHLAAAYGACEFARNLIRAGVDINSVNQNGSSPLHLAAANGEYQIVRCLLEAGADVDMVDAAGNTPLIDAAFVTQPTVSAAPTPFAFGDQHTQGKVVRLLLAHRADPNAVNLEGNNALFGAVRNQFEDVIDQLSHHDLHTTCFQWRNNQQETLLHIAARAQVTNVSIWQTLLKFCETGSVSAFDRFERSCLSIWLSRPWSTLYTDRNEHDAVALVSETALGTLFILAIPEQTATQQMPPTDNSMRTTIPEIEQSTATTTKPCHDDALVVKQTQFQIREYVPDDYDDVAQLVSDGLMFYSGEGSPHHAYWVLFVQNSLATDVADISGHYLREGNTFFVVTTTTPSGETVTVGTIGVEKISDSVAELRRVSVKDTYRRFGIGKFMMARVSEWAKARRYATLVLSCAEVQTQARRFYESLGYAFTKTSVRHEGNESMVLTHYEKPL